MHRSFRFLIGVFIFFSMISAAFAQTYLLNETFGTVPPSGWTNGAVAPTSGSSGYDDYSCLTFNENKTGSAISIVTTAVTDPDRVSFWYQANNNAYNGTFTVKYSTSSSGPWTSWVSVGSVTTSYAQSATEFSGAAGTYYFQLERTGSTGNKKDLHIDVFQVTQSIVVGATSLSSFVYEPSNGPSPEQSFTVSGANLTADIVMTSPADYEISTGTGGSFSASNPLTLTQSGGSVAETTIYVRLKSDLSAGSYNDEVINIASTGKFGKTVTCNGDVRQSINVSTENLSNFNYDTGAGPSAEQNFTVSGQDLTANMVITPPADYEISTGTGGSFSATNPLTLAPSSGLVSETTIYVRLKAGLSQGTYNSKNLTIGSTGKVSHTVSCSGFVGPLILNIKVFLEGSLF